MPSSLHVVFAGIAGVGIGTGFFVGLWWTVQRGMNAKQPAALFLVSLLLRTGATAVAFVLVAAGDWRYALACLVGFVVARTVLLKSDWMRTAVLARIAAQVQP